MAYSVPPSNEQKNVTLTALTSVSSTMDEAYLGCEIECQEGQRFKYVLNSTTTTATNGATYPAFYFENLGQNGATVTTTHDGDLGRSFAGVLAADQAAGGNYCWIQTAGIVPSCLVSTSVAAIGDTGGCREAGMLTRMPVEAISTSAVAFVPDTGIEPILFTAMQAASGGMADVVLHGRGK